LVVILPKTKDIVRQKSTSLFSDIRVEYGEKSHAPIEKVKTAIGVHSRKAGRTGRLSLRRALMTLITQNGTCTPKSEVTRIGTHRSLTE